MSGFPPRSQISGARAAGIALALALASASPGGAVEELPEGIAAGKWILVPSVVTGVTYTTNPFYQSEVNEPESDRIFVVTPRLAAILPFSNSNLAFDYEISKYDFKLQSDNLPTDTVQTFGGVLNLVFESFDQFQAGYHRTSGLARALVYDAGGEAVSDGSEFTFTEYDVGVGRDIIGRRGYAVALMRQTLQFAPGTEVRFFDYDGWILGAEYREPLSPVRWLTLSLEGRDFDHFEVDNPDPEPFRREESLAAYVGMTARVGVRRTYRVRLGYRRSEYPGSDASDFEGVVGDVYLFLGLGARSQIIVTFDRRPWSSFFVGNNYYVSTRIRVGTQKWWTNRVQTGLAVGGALNEYPDSVRFDLFGQPVDILREDNLWDAEVYANFMILDRFGFRVSARHQERSSNVPTADYVADILFAGVSLGWF